MIINLQRLFELFSKRRKIQFFLLIIFMMISSLLESLGIGLIVPFIKIISQPDSLFEDQSLSFFLDFLGINSDREAVLFICMIFILISTLITIFKFLYSYSQMRFATLVSLDLSDALFKGIINQPYAKFNRNNESDLITFQSVKVNQVLMFIIVPMLTIMSSTMIAIAIGALIFFFDPTLAIFIIVGFIMMYLIAVFLLKTRLLNLSEDINYQQNLLARVLKNVFGSKKDMILGNTQNFYEAIFNKANTKLRSSHAKKDFFRTSPRYFVEYFLIIGFTIMSYVYFYSSNEAIEDNLALLSVVAIAAIRLLPMVQNAFSGWFNIKSHQFVLEDLLNAIYSVTEKNEREIENQSRVNNIDFNQDITLTDVSFKHQDQLNETLKNISLKILKGKRIAILGESGSGKSSLVDLIMGLNFPSSGNISVDGLKLGPENVNSWMKKIRHVPQEIFILDRTIRENIAFGLESNDIDDDLINLAINYSSLSDFISKSPNGINTIIGDGADPISGGERQRIGIARALYNSKFELLILDESTNALDVKNEKVVLDKILHDLPNSITIIMVTHRIDTAMLFDTVYEIQDKKLNLIHRN